MQFPLQTLLSGKLRYPGNMSLNEMKDVLIQFVNLLKKWKMGRFRAFLSLGGGEPFLHRDFYSFLAKVCKYTDFYRWDLMSNGSLISRENVEILKHSGISYVQVSLEGLEENNDKIRGEGNFKKALEGIKILAREGVSVSVGLTLTKENIKDVWPLADLLAKAGVQSLSVRRLVPWGQGAQLAHSLLEPDELLRFYRQLKKFNHLKILSGCDNSFLTTGADCSEQIYCWAVRGSILTLLPNGDIYPCRRLPIKIGNILENSLEEIYYSDKIKELRDIKKFPQYCKENCPDFNHCFGGAKCITYAFSGRLDIPDVQCPKAYQKLDKSICKINTGCL